jgi:hypothetical protein
MSWKFRWFFVMFVLGDLLHVLLDCIQRRVYMCWNLTLRLSPRSNTNSEIFLAHVEMAKGGTKV